MKREELKDLGLTAEQVDSIMKIHGTDVESFKSKYADYDELKTKNEELSKQVAKNEKDLKSLSKSTKDNEDLQNTIKSLQDENKQIKTDFESKISSMKLNSAIDTSLAGHKARNTKAVKALLDMDNIKLNDKGELEGLDDQIANIEKDNAFMFDKGTNTNYEPVGNSNSGLSDKDAFLANWGVKPKE
ncbi:phage scaffolding protein [Apilactobacillus sp. EABW-1NA]|uniref:phage scaffolding protein n=1 Tax=Apilactobacillus sp. EABW-1NA TaxID=2984137 RepID=UPI0025AEEBCC|nr:phage scaffolding protein [Apilactobacillus sp. EABW-1NA]MDN2612999.1 phage scaffolding protein [Apilactobacillus sp. EABW-1NA]